MEFIIAAIFGAALCLVLEHLAWPKLKDKVGSWFGSNSSQSGQ